MMKLYVLGTTNPNPEEWGAWNTRALVLAASLEAALALDDSFSVGCEVDMSRACHLMRDEPRNGL